ncbi:hypothetical protein OC842_000723 [Tilletia horrida]|uniref:U2 snRNP-associated SURP motif-containing protein n=1 Tax=Tilletia horrida TaxID=155126 RepID=A0AAN6GGL0_9BASI|nr:hypothetical protein OC842_000723 [Tilletia horrida]
MSHRAGDHDARGPQPAVVKPHVAAAALYRSAAANQTLNIDKFRERSPTPERDPDIVAFLAAQEAAAKNASGKSRRAPLTAEQSRVRREREVGASASTSTSAAGASASAQGAAGQGDTSISSWAGSSVVKSKFQREREEAERKAKEAEEAAARAYEEFTADMGGTGGWRAGAVNSSRAGAGSSATPYVPPRASAAGTSTNSGGLTNAAASSAAPDTKPKPVTETSRPAFKRPLGVFGDDAEDEPESKPVKAEPPGKRMRVMEDFIGQLQRDQKAREERFKGRISPFEGQKQGSRDTGDPLTTNVCVLNLPANISEDVLGNFFKQWGDIMWPRGEESGMAGGAGAGITFVRRMQSAGLTGFVCFMRRGDAELALRESDGITWSGSMIKTSWGKAMPIPIRPQFYAPKKQHRERSNSPSAPRRPRADGADAALRKHRTSRPKLRSERSFSAYSRSPSPRSKFRLRCEDEFGAEAVNVRTVAQRVQQHGPKFEELLRAKEKENPKFAFLWDDKSLLHQYYQLFVDPNFEPTAIVESFRDEGDAAVYSSDTGEDSEAESLRKQRRDVIGPAALRRFTAMLRSLTPRRERIARCMIFALDHAHACEQVVDVLCQSLLIPSTPIPRKIARLYVVSDILHNSANPLPNVWKFRLLLEKRLPEVFEHLGDVGRSFPSRMKAESWKQMVGHVLSAWESWSVFSSGVLEGLGAALLAPAEAPKEVPDGGGDRLQPPAFEEEEDDDGEAFDPSALYT